MVMKRGQFFLLAAVVISVVVISLGITANQARAIREPTSFYDYSYEVKRETGAVIDYSLYKGFDDDANLTAFVDLLAADIRDRDPSVNFMFIYGNSDSAVLRNYGATSASVNGMEVPGGGEPILSYIYVGGNKVPVVGEYGDYVGDEINLVGEEQVDIEIDGYEFEFPLSEYKQVIFVMQKDDGGDSYVAVK